MCFLHLLMTPPPPRTLLVRSPDDVSAICMPVPNMELIEVLSAVSC